MTRERILLADDHGLVMEGLRTLLTPHFDIVGEATDGRKLMEQARKLEPDVVLIDLSMPLLNGLDAGKVLKTLLPKTKLIVVTMNEDPQIAENALRTWASGYVLKKSRGAELIRGIREVLSGKTYVSPQIARVLMERFIHDPRPEHISKLTSRQREILQLLAEGKNMKEVATILAIAHRTVAFHKYRIMEEYNLKTNADLMLLAIHEHLITP
jgi:DNA-binding NarL/FixJ family response regulator